MCADVQSCERLERNPVMLEYAVNGLISLSLLAYLIYALLRPEKF